MFLWHGTGPCFRSSDCFETFSERLETWLELVLNDLTLRLGWPQKTGRQLWLLITISLLTETLLWLALQELRRTLKDLITFEDLRLDKNVSQMTCLTWTCLKDAKLQHKRYQVQSHYCWLSYTVNAVKCFCDKVLVRCPGVWRLVQNSSACKSLKLCSLWWVFVFVCETDTRRGEKVSV